MRGELKEGKLASDSKEDIDKELQMGWAGTAGTFLSGGGEGGSRRLCWLKQPELPEQAEEEVELWHPAECKLAGKSQNSRGDGWKM